VLAQKNLKKKLLPSTNESTTLAPHLSLSLCLSLCLSPFLPIWFSYAAGRKAPRGVGKGRGGKQEHITLEAPEKERETGGEGLLPTEV
jgi:hypothetical protein